MGLCISRKLGQRIKIGDKITVIVYELSKRSVRLFIEAPGSYAIVREGEEIKPLIKKDKNSHGSDGKQQHKHKRNKSKSGARPADRSDRPRQSNQAFLTKAASYIDKKKSQEKTGSITPQADNSGSLAGESS